MINGKKKKVRQENIFNNNFNILIIFNLQLRF